jgi:hypothetical protein
MGRSSSWRSGFPAVAKYDDVEGWNTLPYMSVGEFYTDFGDYEVAITCRVITLWARRVCFRMKRMC